MKSGNTFPYAAIGRVPVAYGAVELAMQTLCWLLVDSRDPDAVSAATSELHFRELGLLLNRLAKRAQLSSPHKDRCEDLLRRAKDLAKGRNEAPRSQSLSRARRPCRSPVCRDASGLPT